jgi:hypothetical protein
MMEKDADDKVRRAAKVIKAADALLITSGAGSSINEMTHGLRSGVLAKGLEENISGTAIKMGSPKAHSLVPRLENSRRSLRSKIHWRLIP